MPETRYMRNFDVDGNELPPTPYEVSDEQLQREADEARLCEICDMGHSAMPVPVLAEGFVLLCKQLGYG